MLNKIILFSGAIYDALWQTHGSETGRSQNDWLFNAFPDPANKAAEALDDYENGGLAISSIEILGKTVLEVFDNSTGKIYRLN